MAASPLFKPFRALGYITDNVPFAVNRRVKETYVLVSVGKAWQVRHSTCACQVRCAPTAVRVRVHRHVVPSSQSP